MDLNKASLPFKTLLFLTGIMAFIGCKKVHQSPPNSKTGRMLQVELRMAEPWKKIVIGPTRSKEYPKIPQSFSMFMAGESTSAIKSYLRVEDSTGKEYSILLAMTTGHYAGGKTLSVSLRHAAETSHNFHAQC